MLKVNSKDIQDRFSESRESREARGGDRYRAPGQDYMTGWYRPSRKTKCLPDLTEFRAKIRVKGSLSEAVHEERGRARK